MKITSEDLLSLLEKHGEFGMYVKAVEQEGLKGAIIDGFFDLDAIAADINHKFKP